MNWPRSAPACTSGTRQANLGRLGAGDTLVVSSAIRPDNPELAEASRRGMRVLHRAAALASVMAGRRVIAIAGTHGKTTTTSMLTTVLRECGADPGYVIGGILTETGLGAEDGTGMDFVAEADESDGSFLLLSPDVAVITNVEADHLDNYASLADIEAAFTTFGGRVSGTVLTCADDPGAEVVAARLERVIPGRVRRTANQAMPTTGSAMSGPTGWRSASRCAPTTARSVKVFPI
jgi:UDP-N-acetylmuramate-alanine ligase